MDTNELYKQIMGIESPRHVIDRRLDAPSATVDFVAEFRGDLCCPQCRKKYASYDARRRVFRHLDTSQYKTHLIVDVPRIECLEHGAMRIDISWAERNSGFSALETELG